MAPKRAKTGIERAIAAGWMSSLMPTWMTMIVSNTVKARIDSQKARSLSILVRGSWVTILTDALNAFCDVLGACSDDLLVSEVKGVTSGFEGDACLYHDLPCSYSSPSRLGSASKRSTDRDDEYATVEDLAYALAAGSFEETCEETQQIRFTFLRGARHAPTARHGTRRGAGHGHRLGF